MKLGGWAGQSGPALPGDATQRRLLVSWPNWREAMRYGPAEDGFTVRWSRPSRRREGACC